MSHPDRDHVDGRLDLVPMIDCIMLLLLFFILTTRFSGPEGGIASLLPTNGPAARIDATIPPPGVTVRVVPRGCERGATAAECREALASIRGIPQAAWLSIGDAAPLELDASRLATPAGAVAELDRVHAYVRDALARAEVAGAQRREQAPVTIHCFSGMPWAFALAAYDACRAYEQAAGAKGPGLDDARVVDLAAPRVRHVAEPAQELAEIVSMR